MLIIFMYVLVIQEKSKKFYEKMNLILLISKLVMILVGWVVILLSLAILFRQGTNK